LIINSCGGNGGQMFAISDYLRMMKTKVVTVGMGVVFSAAVPILASGNVRKAFRNTDFMFHGASFSSPNSVTSLDSAISAEYRVKLESKLYMAMADLTKKPKSFWRNMIDSHCHYFSAAEALEWGVIDEIL